jgi:hypothetical protein
VSSSNNNPDTSAEHPLYGWWYSLFLTVNGTKIIYKFTFFSNSVNFLLFIVAPYLCIDHNYMTKWVMSSIGILKIQ